MKQFLYQLNTVRPDIIFVGGVSEYLQGVRSETKDVDICVKHIDGLDFFGEIEIWKSMTPFTISGNRAGIKSSYVIDIFIEDDLPDYVIIDGLKCEKLECLLTRYKDIVPKLDKDHHYHSRLKMINKINNLENYINNSNNIK